MAIAPLSLPFYEQKKHFALHYKTVLPFGTITKSDDIDTLSDDSMLELTPATLLVSLLFF
jgi:hypothetical protein